MKTHQSSSSRQKITDKFLRSAMIGTVAMLLFLVLIVTVGFFDDTDDTTAGLIFGSIWLLTALFVLVSLIYSFIYMTWRRRTDEFTLAMWHSGTTVAFFVAIAWLLIGGVIEGVVIGFLVVDSPETVDAEVGLIDAWSLPIILAGFFVGFHFKRLRGDV